MYINKNKKNAENESCLILYKVYHKLYFIEMLSQTISNTIIKPAFVLSIDLIFHIKAGIEQYDKRNSEDRTILNIWRLPQIGKM